MSATIPFGRETFRPISILGNADASNPVEFDIQAVGGVGRQRLQGMLAATRGLATGDDIAPGFVQEALLKAAEIGPLVFAEGVTAVRGLTAKAAHLRAVGVLERNATNDALADDQEIPIRTGYEFSRVAGYWPLVAFEVAMAIARVCGQAEVDPRFFGWLSTLSGSPMSPIGTAGPVGRKRAPRGTVASGTRKAKPEKTT